MSEYDSIPHNCWLEVDLGRWKRNIRIITEKTGNPILAVIKANAYGHGLERMGLAAEEAGVRYLGVVTTAEAFLLRQAGIKCRILRMAAWLPEDLPLMIDQKVDFPVWTDEQVLQVQSEAKARGEKALVQIKVDTGMGRLGVFPGHAAELANLISKQQTISKGL